MHLAVAASLLLVLLAGLGVVLGAAVDAPARATALGRLRSLGLADRELRRVLAGELLVPVLASVLTGLVVGVATAWATFGSLGLEEVTGQSEAPQLVVPLWTGLAVLALPLVALVLAARQQPAPAHQPGAAAAQRRLPLAGSGRQRSLALMGSGEHIQRMAGASQWANGGTTHRRVRGENSAVGSGGTWDVYDRRSEVDSASPTGTVATRAGA